MESIMQKIFDAKVPTRTDYMELSLFDSNPEWKRQQDEEIEIQLKKMEENEKISHTYFAHNNKQMDPTRLTASLEEAKSVIGGVKDTRDFVIEQLLHVGVSVQTDDLPSATASTSWNCQPTCAIISRTKPLPKESFASPSPLLPRSTICTSVVTIPSWKI